MANAINGIVKEFEPLNRLMGSDYPLQFFDLHLRHWKILTPDLHDFSGVYHLLRRTIPPFSMKMT